MPFLLHFSIAFLVLQYSRSAVTYVVHAKLAKDTSTTPFFIKDCTAALSLILYSLFSVEEIRTDPKHQKNLRFSSTKERS